MPIPIIPLLTGAATLASAPGAIDWVGDQSNIKKTVSRDGITYTPGEEIERNTLESIGDFIFRRDKDDLTEAAKKNRIRDISESQIGGLLLDAGVGITGETLPVCRPE